MIKKIKKLFCMIFGHNYVKITVKNTAGKTVSYIKCSNCDFIDWEVTL